MFVILFRRSHHGTKAQSGGGGGGQTIGELFKVYKTANLWNAGLKQLFQVVLRSQFVEQLYKLKNPQLL